MQIPLIFLSDFQAFEISSIIINKKQVLSSAK